MDRFDCQYLMATFVNVYIASFIRCVCLLGWGLPVTARAGNQWQLCSLIDLTAENTAQRKRGLRRGRIFSRAGNTALTSHGLLLFQSH